MEPELAALLQHPGWHRLNEIATQYLHTEAFRLASLEDDTTVKALFNRLKGAQIFWGSLCNVVDVAGTDRKPEFAELVTD